MEYKNIFIHILSFLHPQYRPFLRLICKRWAERIKERVCRGEILAKECKSLEFIYFLERYFPVRHVVYICKIAVIKHFDAKFEILDYLVSKGIKLLLPKRWDYLDLPTVKWLEQQNYTFPDNMTLDKYEKDAFIFLKNKTNISFHYTVLIPLKYLHDVYTTDSQLYVQYIGHGLLDNAKKYLSTACNNMALYHAIKGEHKECIQYLSQEFAFYPGFFSIASEKIALFLLDYTFTEIPILETKHSFQVYQKYCQLYNPNNLWITAILTNDIELCNWLEWKGLSVPTDIFKIVKDYLAKNMNHVPTVSCTILDYCYKKKVDFDTEKDTYLAEQNDDGIQWYIDKGYELTFSVLYGLVLYGTFQMYERISSKIPEIPEMDIKSRRLYYSLEARGYPLFIKSMAPILLKMHIPKEMVERLLSTV